jgi:hypothetical protein
MGYHVWGRINCGVGGTEAKLSISVVHIFGDDDLASPEQAGIHGKGSRAKAN